MIADNSVENARFTKDYYKSKGSDYESKELKSICKENYLEVTFATARYHIGDQMLFLSYCFSLYKFLQ